VNLTRALGTLFAGLQDRKEKLHRDKKEATKKVELPRNLQQSRQPADAGRARWLRARSAGGCWRSFFEGPGFILSAHPIFSFDEP